MLKNSELNLIKEGIKKNFDKRIQKYQLLLRGSRNGFSAKDFHSKWDEQFYTLTFIETQKGRRLGDLPKKHGIRIKVGKRGQSPSFFFR